MNILVLGKDGQLGKAFKSLFNSLAIPKEVSIEYVGRAECDLGNASELEFLLVNKNPNLIINASAYTAVDKAESETDLAFAVNAKAPELMAQYAAQNDATLLHFSTDYVFDGNKSGFYLEDDQRNPLGVYGKSKAAGEVAIEKTFANSQRGQFAILRTSWVYGNGGNFIRTILRLAKEREELKIIHDQHGVPTSADWLAQVSLDLVLDYQFNLRRFSSGIYHAVPAGETTWYELATLVVQVAKNAGIELRVKAGSIKPILAIDYPLPAPRPMNSRLDRSKLSKALELQGDMSKLDSFNKPWMTAVEGYVQSLANNGLI
ncbi:dTDP-4-dehydrorhamnose reductase [Polynucleobacter sp. MWH-Braz-FAM2G]|uniref:dTDP-4-dehydrorhamnose reductase n=1 Tax=Polynucleobacter sp. MWH-Braz-FAM2G TaxID=1855883 RepID=UPI001BFDB1E1|nr:dTDP-4-dehydrorhamnose reductase [Polynucleobacter sp. MWH-Braz-FAM2G]QWD91017.1 dTDP-4-dehydrorhamnose reductase [Polynucleobacter sp. MWH-Braz-FAM2G]